MFPDSVPPVTPESAPEPAPEPAPESVPVATPIAAPITAQITEPETSFETAPETGPETAGPASPGLPGARAEPVRPAAAAPSADPNPTACAQQLKQLFPALFAGAPKPLKLRIQIDIQARAPGVFSKQALSAFFRRYTGSTAYLIAVSRAKQRFDLDGQPNGDLSDEHRQVALDELARRRTNNESRIALEEQQRRNRATLLHDFQITTLTPANFCALKGIAVEELDGYLVTARREAEERAQQAQQAHQAPPFHSSQSSAT